MTKKKTRGPGRPRNFQLSRNPLDRGTLLQMLVLRESTSKTEVMNSTQHLRGVYMTLWNQQALLRKAERMISALSQQHYMYRVRYGPKEEEIEMRCAGCGAGAGLWPCKVMGLVQQLHDAPLGEMVH